MNQKDNSANNYLMFTVWIKSQYYFHLLKCFDLEIEGVFDSILTRQFQE